MNYKISHNSYWIDGDPIKLSVLNGCDILDVDIIDKDLHLSHSWRPRKSMYYGTLQDRYLKSFPGDCTLYVEFKTADPRVPVALYEALKKYRFKSLVLVSYRFNPFFPLRWLNAKRFYEAYLGKLRLMKFSDFKRGHKLKSLNLFTSSFWHF